MKVNINIPRAPSGLSGRSRRFWKQINEAYVLESHALKLLEEACWVLDRIQQDQATVEDEGRTYTDKNGCPRLHPSIDSERQQRNLLIRLLRELRLGDGEIPEESRPPRLKYGK